MKKLKSILLIDDNRHTNILNKKLIDKLGICENLWIVENGKEGIDFLKHEGKFSNGNINSLKPNIIFLDLNMPVMDGWEFLEEYRHLKPEQKAHVLIIMLTTSPNPEDEARALAIPEVTGFERKPLNVEMMWEIIRNYFPE